MAYERLSRPGYPGRLYGKHVSPPASALTGSLMVVSLIIGMGGYQHFGPMGWDDAFANASMIMSEHGPCPADHEDRRQQGVRSAYATTIQACS